MSYRSDLVIAATQELHDTCVALGNLPALLESADSHLVSDGCVYWRFNCINWHKEIGGVRALTNWLEWCENNDEAHGSPSFGAIRLGENYSDSEDWGWPADFDVGITHAIAMPTS